MAAVECLPAETERPGMKPGLWIQIIPYCNCALTALSCRSLSLDAHLQELGHALAVVLKHLREHGDRGHAGEGVDLIEEDLAVGADEEVDPREIAELELVKCLEGQGADLLLLLIAELSLNNGLSLA